MKSWQMLGFAAVMLTVWGLFHAYIGFRLVVPARLSGVPAFVAWSALGFTWLVFPAVFILRWYRPDFAGIHSLELAAYWVFGFISIIFPLLVFRDLAWLAVYLGGFLPREPVRAGDWLGISGTAVVILTFLMLGGGWLEYRRGPLLERVDLRVSGLPRALEGYKIVQLTDIHVGVTARKDRISRIVSRVNALKPDIIAVTGDMADGLVRDFGADAAPLAGMNPPDGKLFVTGNHEYFYDYRGWMKELPRLGFRVLINSSFLVRKGKAVLAFGGITDSQTAARFTPGQAANPGAAARGIPKGAVKILLSHQPASAPMGALAGFDFQLSGHTHGGQYFPWSMVILRLPFARPGFHQVGKMALYVSRGTGAWGPPIRLFVPGEITLFTLRRKD